jgi:WD40 repeat protein
MPRSKQKLSRTNFRGRQRLIVSILAVAEVFAIGGAVFAQNAQGTSPASSRIGSATIERQGAQAGAPSRAYVDFLLAFMLADDGSKPEALRRLAESLRLQPQNNPASGLVFQLLTEQRTNSRLILRGHTGAILYAAYSSDGTKIVTASADHTARIWDAQTGKQLVPPLQHGDDVLMADFSPDGRLVVTGSEDRTARVWDVATGRPIGAPLQAADAMRWVRFSPDGKLVATASDDSKARLWDAATGLPVSPFIVYHEAVNSINFSPDGSRALTATGDGVADILDAQTGKRLLKPLRQNNTISTAIFSRDGNTILTASADHTAKMWNAKTGVAFGPVFHHGFSIESAVFNYDASRVLTTSLDHTARVWDATTGKPVTPPLQHGDSVLNGIFSPDGNIVATTCRDRTARIWDAVSGEPVRLPVRSKDNITAAGFSPNGSSLLVASADTVQVFDMPPHESAPAWVADLAEFAATQTKYNQSQLPDLAKIRPLRAQLLASRSSDPWAAFGRWYFSESDVRPISPWSTVSLQQYVESLIALGDKDSLQYASELSYDHPAWMVRIVPMRNKPAATTTDSLTRP